MLAPCRFGDVTCFTDGAWVKESMVVRVDGHRAGGVARGNSGRCVGTEVEEVVREEAE
jgi:hypothetical protein